MNLNGENNWRQIWGPFAVAVRVTVYRRNVNLIGQARHVTVSRYRHTRDTRVCLYRGIVWERGVSRLECLQFLFCKNCQTNCRQSGSSSPVWRHTPLRTCLRSRPRSPLKTHRAGWHCLLQPFPPKLHTVPPQSPSVGHDAHVNVAAAIHVSQGQSCADLGGETGAR